MKKQLIAFFSMFCLLIGTPTVWAETDIAKAAEPAKTTAVTTETETKAVKYQQPVAFAVLDRTGQVNSSIFDEWRRQVKQAYRIPYYEINDSQEINATVQEVLASEGRTSGTLDVGTLRKIAEKTKCDVVTIMVIHEMSEYIIHSFWSGPFSCDGPEEYVRTIASADLYVYKKDGDKMLKSIVREIDTTDLSLETHPEVTIKYAMRHLVNKMENRPQI